MIVIQGNINPNNNEILIYNGKTHIIIKFTSSEMYAGRKSLLLTATGNVDFLQNNMNMLQ